MPDIKLPEFFPNHFLHQKYQKKISWLNLGMFLNVCFQHLWNPFSCILWWTKSVILNKIISVVTCMARWDYATNKVKVLNWYRFHTLVLFLFPSHTLSSQTSSISWQMSAFCVQEYPFSPQTLTVLPLSDTENLSKTNLNDSVSSLNYFIHYTLWHSIWDVLQWLFWSFGQHGYPSY